jgi:hypothetical protein
MEIIIREWIAPIDDDEVHPSRHAGSYCIIAEANQPRSKIEFRAHDCAERCRQLLAERAPMYFLDDHVVLIEIDGITFRGRRPADGPQPAA